MSVQQTLAYGRVVTTTLSQEEATDLAKSELMNEGFGVLCEIDVANTLKEKIGAEVPAYRILGACNPNFAHQALQHESQLGLLLPCNVVVQQIAGETTVSAIDARALLGIVKNDELLTVADDVNARLGRVLDRIAER